MRNTKFFALLTLLAGFLVNAQAAPVGFNGVYDYSTWTSAETYGGATFSSVDASKQTLTMMEIGGLISSLGANQWTIANH